MKWAFSGVYGSCDLDGFGLLWEELGRVQSDCEVLWCVGGDFNAIWHPGERLGASRMTSHM